MNEIVSLDKKQTPAAEPFPRRLCRRTVRASRAVGRQIAWPRCAPRPLRRARLWRLALRGATPRGPGNSGAAGQFRARGPRWHGQGERQHHGRFLARLHLGVYRGKYLRPCQRLYRQAQRRYRRPRQAGRSFSRKSPRPSSIIRSAGRGNAQPDAGDVAPELGKCRSRQRHLAARQAAGRKGLGDPATGRRSTGSASRRSRRRSASPSRTLPPSRRRSRCCISRRTIRASSLRSTAS